MSEAGFRGYLADLAATEDAVAISEEISWNLEASAITMMANQTGDRIPVFESVGGGNESGARLVGDPYRGSRTKPWSRLARALGLDPDLSGEEYYRRIIDRLRNPVEPEHVSRTDAPCKEVVREAGDADLLRFPWPYIHAGDGGRYSNLHTLVAPMHDRSWYNWTYHRAMIHDDDTASVLLLAGENTPNQYYYEYEPRDEPMPVAIVVGADPAVQCTTVMQTPTSRPVAEFAGGLKGDPVELVECETSDLLVPADAEIVIEGEIQPNVRRDEGPFGDYFGYMHGPRRSMPMFKLDAITHRERPYIPFCVEGSGVGYGTNSTSSLDMGCLGPNATLALRVGGFSVEQCIPWQYSPRSVYVISTDNPWKGYLHNLVNFVFSTTGTLHADILVLVDETVDPFDPREVLEAIALHANPDTDFHQFGEETMPEVPMNVYQPPAEKRDIQTGTTKVKTAKAAIDATRTEQRDDNDCYPRRRAQTLLHEAGIDRDRLDLLSVPADGDSR